MGWQIIKGVFTLGMQAQSDTKGRAFTPAMQVMQAKTVLSLPLCHLHLHLEICEARANASTRCDKKTLGNFSFSYGGVKLHSQWFYFSYIYSVCVYVCLHLHCWCEHSLNFTSQRITGKLQLKVFADSEF